jgi:hypothetical protein
MTVNTKVPFRAGPHLVAGLSAGVSETPLWTTAERLQRIEALGQRINGYVQFMCQLDNLNGTSAEAKDKAVIAFYEQLVVLERRLGRIQDNLKLE